MTHTLEVDLESVPCIGAKTKRFHRFSPKAPCSRARQASKANHKIPADLEDPNPCKAGCLDVSFQETCVARKIVCPQTLRRHSGSALLARASMRLDLFQGMSRTAVDPPSRKKKKLRDRTPPSQMEQRLLHVWFPSTFRCSPFRFPSNAAPKRTTAKKQTHLRCQDGYLLALLGNS